jgi:hypothetical protein
MRQAHEDRNGEQSTWRPLSHQVRVLCLVLFRGTEETNIQGLFTESCSGFLLTNRNSGAAECTGFEGRVHVECLRLVACLMCPRMHCECHVGCHTH